MRPTDPSVSRRQFLCAAGAAAATSVALPATGQSAENEPKKNSLHLGLASYTTRNFSLEQTIEMAVRLSLKNLCLKSFHLPLDASARQCAAAAEKCTKAGLKLYGGGVITMKNEADVNRAFDYAKAAGMNVIVGVPYPDVLPLVDRKVQEYNIKVAIHNHGPGDEMYPTPESAVEKIRDLDPRIGLCIDIGHTVRIGSDPVVDVVRFSDRVHDLHVKDVSAAEPSGQTLEIGRGVIDIPAFLKALLRTDYTGIVSFEYEKDADDPLPGLAESVGYVRGVLAAI